MLCPKCKYEMVNGPAQHDEANCLRAQVAILESQLVSANSLARDLITAVALAIDTGREERDALRGELDTILAERDAAVSMGTQLERERDAERERREMMESRSANR